MAKKALVKNAADRKQVKEAEEKLELEELEEREDFRAVLKTKEGQRVMWRILSDCGIFTSSFNHSGSITYFNEGRREVGLGILAKVQDHVPEYFIEMMKLKAKME